MSKPKTGRTSHVLDDVIITHPSLSWTERVKGWAQPMALHERLQWLHANVARDGNGPEQFIFYLRMADSYGVGGHFNELPNHQEHHLTLHGYIDVAREKKMLAQKAFTLLCTHFLSDQRGHNAQYPLALLYKTPLFAELLWFFRPGFDGGPGGWDNLRPKDPSGLGNDGGKHYLARIDEFAREFSLQAWQILNGYYYGPLGSDDLDPDVIRPHLRDIVRLMTHLRTIKCAERGQFVPSPEVFNQLVDLVVSRYYTAEPKEGIVPYTGTACDAGPLLEPYVGKGDLLASVLYMARFDVAERHADRGAFKLKRRR